MTRLHFRDEADELNPDWPRDLLGNVTHSFLITALETVEIATSDPLPCTYVQGVKYEVYEADMARLRDRLTMSLNNLERALGTRYEITPAGRLALEEAL